MGQVVLIIGEAGLGKSRLVHSLKRHVIENSVGDGDPIIEWRSSQQRQSSSLYPAIECFERLLGLDRDDTPADATRQAGRLPAIVRPGRKPRDRAPRCAALNTSPRNLSGAGFTAPEAARGTRSVAARLAPAAVAQAADVVRDRRPALGRSVDTGVRRALGRPGTKSPNSHAADISARV